MVVVVVWGWGVQFWGVQLVECLPRIHEALGSTHSTTKTKNMTLMRWKPEGQKFKVILRVLERAQTKEKGNVPGARCGGKCL